MQFVCIRKCFWESLIEEGLVINLDSENEIPKEIRHCFQSKDEAEKVKEAEVEAEAESVDAIKNLQEEMDKLGKSYDRRWGVRKLEFALKQAKKGMS